MNRSMLVRDPIERDHTMCDYYGICRTRIFYLHDDDDGK